MNLLSLFVRDQAARQRLLLFGLCGALAMVIGFKAVTPRLAEGLIINGGYYYMFGLFGLFVFFAVRVARARRRMTRWTTTILLSTTTGRRVRRRNITDMKNTGLSQSR